MELYQILLRKLQFPPTGYSLLNPVCASVLDRHFFCNGCQHCRLALLSDDACHSDQQLLSFIFLFPSLIFLFLPCSCFHSQSSCIHSFFLVSIFSIFFNFLFFSSIPLTFYLFIYFSLPLSKAFFSLLFSHFLFHSWLSFLSSCTPLICFLFIIFSLCCILMYLLCSCIIYFGTHKVIVKRDKSIIPKNINFCSA